MPSAYFQTARAPRPATAPWDASLVEGLQQRGRLFDMILADLLGSRTILRRDRLPAKFAPGPSSPSDRRRLGTYTAEIVHCPDQVWRVAGHRGAADNHPSARLLEAPGLAAFLPGLCRFLLGETLRLASVPSLWLADPGALPEVGANLHRWAIVDAFRPGPAASVVNMSIEQRILLQERVAAAPWRFAARLLVTAPPQSVTMARTESGIWQAVGRAAAA